jgi:hypothetical protein
MKKPPPIITAAVEGDVDEAVIRRLVTGLGQGEIGSIHGKNGKSDLLKKISAYNSAAKHSPWIVLVDLDNDAECAPPMRAEWIPYPTAGMFFRIAVRSIESWLLSDREAISHFLSIGLKKVPYNPDEIENPKRMIVDLARLSRNRDIREDIVPRPRSGRNVGQAYTSRMIEYVGGNWRPDVAARSSDSLRRCLTRLKKFTGR